MPLHATHDEVEAKKNEKKTLVTNEKAENFYPPELAGANYSL